MLSGLFFFGQVMILTEGISHPKTWPGRESVGQIKLIGRFLKFYVNKEGVSDWGIAFNENCLRGGCL